MPVRDSDLETPNPSSSSVVSREKETLSQSQDITSSEKSLSPADVTFEALCSRCIDYAREQIARVASTIDEDDDGAADNSPSQSIGNNISTRLRYGRFDCIRNVQLVFRMLTTALQKRKQQEEVVFLVKNALSAQMDKCIAQDDEIVVSEVYFSIGVVYA